LDRGSIDQILAQAHNYPIGTHPGIYIMMEQIQQNYTWSNIKRDVTTYVKGCTQCQQTKVDHTKWKAPLHPLLAPNYPWEIISVDLIVPLPDSKGYDAIIVVVDSFTKMKVLLPTTTHITTKGVALLFHTQVFKQFGMPTKIILDQGPQFVSNFMKELYSLLSIQGAPSTAWHPQTDGQTEQANQEVE
jgi:Integrase zinc binding domain/Integrase core domain